MLEAQGKLAYRSGQYALIPPYEGPERNITKNELGNGPSWRLYDLTADRGQQSDLAAEHSEEGGRLNASFLSIVGNSYKPAVEGEPPK